LAAEPTEPAGAAAPAAAHAPSHLGTRPLAVTRCSERKSGRPDGQSEKRRLGEGGGGSGTDGTAHRPVSGQRAVRTVRRAGGAVKGPDPGKQQCRARHAWWKSAKVPKSLRDFGALKRTESSDAPPTLHHNINERQHAGVHHRIRGHTGHYLPDFHPTPSHRYTAPFKTHINCIPRPSLGRDFGHTTQRFANIRRT